MPPTDSNFGNCPYSASLFHAFHFPETRYRSKQLDFRHENNQRSRFSSDSIEPQGTLRRGNPCGHARISGRGLRHPGASLRRQAPLRPGQGRVHRPVRLQPATARDRKSDLRQLNHRKKASGSSVGTGSRPFRKAFSVCFNPRHRSGSDKNNLHIKDHKVNLFYTVNTLIIFDEHTYGHRRFFMVLHGRSPTRHQPPTIDARCR